MSLQLVRRKGSLATQLPLQQLRRGRHHGEGRTQIVTGNAEEFGPQLGRIFGLPLRVSRDDVRTQPV